MRLRWRCISCLAERRQAVVPDLGLEAGQAPVDEPDDVAVALARILEQRREAFVEPHRDVLTERRVFERDVRELVTKHVVEGRRIGAARREHADEDEMEPRIRDAARIRGRR